MAASARKLDELAALLERTGGDPQRLEAVRRAQRFRRSWLELAQQLYEIRRDGSWETWGYADFHAYCAQELTLKRGTVDKLTISYGTLKRHAPQILERDGVARKIPSIESVGYFARAINDPSDDSDGIEDDLAPRGSGGAAGRKLPPPRVDDPRVRDLATAVFDEGHPVGELRRRFDPVLFPKPDANAQHAVIRRASTAARRLAELLPDIVGLPEDQAERLEHELGALRQVLEELAVRSDNGNNAAPSSTTARSSRGSRKAKAGAAAGSDL